MSENKHTASRIHRPAVLLPAEPSAARSGMPVRDPRFLLQHTFGYPAFRPGQEAFIRALLAGRDTFGILPTGGGKSLCYQIPALALPGTTIVISPLISLMEDQTQALSRRNIAAASLSSARSSGDNARALRVFRAGDLKLLYVSPERLRTSAFLDAAQEAPVTLIAVDEAHCISAWGDDFRPAYRRIPDFVSSLPGRPVLCAFTASAPPEVRRDIIRTLALRDPFVLTTGFNRPNLYFGVLHTRDRMTSLLSLLAPRRKLCGIVYVLTRKTAEHLTAALTARGFPALCYHGGMSAADRSHALGAWLSGDCLLMVATSAFGMGIDKPDVRYVFHYNLPADLEAYYQEAGRAGRDGRPADCILLTDDRDLLTHTFFAEHAGDDAAAIRAEVRLAPMRAYAGAHTCLRQQLLTYFGESAPDFCGNCSVCLSQSELQQSAADSAVLLSRLRAIRARCARRYGVPVWKIFPDSVLTGLTEALPQTRRELLAVEGVSLYACIKYGADFLQEIHAWNCAH